MQANAPVITAADRLGFTLFVATALHAVAILGIGFAMPEPAMPSPTLDITLAQRNEEKAPDKADYLAQSNQQGSGETEEKVAPTTDTAARYQHEEVRETMEEEASARPTEPDQQRQQLSSPSDSQEKVARSEQNPKPSLKPINAGSLVQRSLEIASLEARLEMQRELYAKNPRIIRLTSASTRANQDAWYLESWRRKIEMVGNLNYPDEARRNRIYGNLRLLVSVLPDGAVREIRILESSGHKVLDDAAVRIVRIAEPFAPFPQEMRERADIIEIIRTWQFRKELKSF